MKVEKIRPNFRIGDMVYEEVEDSPTADFYIIVAIDKKNETYDLSPVTFDFHAFRIMSFEYVHRWFKRVSNET